MSRFTKGNNGNNGNGSYAADSSNLNLIGLGTKIVGEITTNGDIRIDGNLKGNITTKGKLIVGVSGEIVGDITCKNLDISGNIEGKIVVEELLSLKSSANIKGDVITSKLHIEPGAIFNGTCNMSGNSLTNKSSINSKAKSVAEA